MKSYKYICLILLATSFSIFFCFALASAIDYNEKSGLNEIHQAAETRSKTKDRR
tara:strand:+ start:755 stop:916 length:162 start_codon:yes stop_codon:yes gene_type:complete